VYEDYDEDLDDIKFEKFAPKSKRRKKSEDWTDPNREFKVKKKQRTEELHNLRKEDEDEDDDS